MTPKGGQEDSLRGGGPFFPELRGKKKTARSLPSPSSRGEERMKYYLPHHLKGRKGVRRSSFRFYRKGLFFLKTRGGREEKAVKGKRILLSPIGGDSAEESGVSGGGCGGEGGPPRRRKALEGSGRRISF